MPWNYLKNLTGRWTGRGAGDAGVCDPVSPRSVLEQVGYWANRRPNSPWLIEHWSDRLTEITWAQARASIDAAARWFAGTFPPGSRIALIGRADAHWILADLAIMSAGLTSVPVVPDTAAEWKPQVGGETVTPDALVIGRTLPSDRVPTGHWKGRQVIRMPRATWPGPALDWDELVRLGASLPACKTRPGQIAGSLSQGAGSTDRDALIFQSMSELLSAGKSVAAGVEMGPGSRIFCLSSLAQLQGRVLSQFGSLTAGASIYFNENRTSTFSDLRRAQATILYASAAFWEDLRAVVSASFVSPEELEAGDQADRLDLREQVTSHLGLRVTRELLAGEGPLPRSTLRYFAAIGLPIREIYGRAGIACASITERGDMDRFSIGVPLSGIQVKLAEDGEVLLRRRLVDPASPEAPPTGPTRRDADWLRTGDLGRRDSTGGVHLEGRCADQFVSRQGARINPASWERAFSDNPMVKVACVIGNALPKAVVLIKLSDDVDYLADPIVAERLKKIARACNDKKEHDAKIGAIIICRCLSSEKNSHDAETLSINRQKWIECHESLLRHLNDYQKWYTFDDIHVRRC